MKRLAVVMWLIVAGVRLASGSGLEFQHGGYYASLDLYQFKAQLESDRILSATQSGWSLEGHFVNRQGVTNQYRVSGSTAGNPFIEEALRARGIELEYGARDIEEYSLRSMWYAASSPVELALLIVVIVLQALVFGMLLLSRARSNRPGRAS